MSKIKEGSLVILHIRDVWSKDLKRTIKRGEKGIVVSIYSPEAWLDTYLSSMFKSKDKMIQIMFDDGLATIFSDWVRSLKIEKTPKSERNFSKYLEKKAVELGKN
jgi:hypothetical protein